MENMVKTNQYQILVVDDDAAIVNILETSLKQAGYGVLTALFLSLGWMVSGTGSPKPELQESMAASFTMFQEEMENSEEAVLVLLSAVLILQRAFFRSTAGFVFLDSVFCGTDCSQRNLVVGTKWIFF